MTCIAQFILKILFYYNKKQKCKDGSLAIKGAFRKWRSTGFQQKYNNKKYNKLKEDR